MFAERFGGAAVAAQAPTPQRWWLLFGFPAGWDGRGVALVWNPLKEVGVLLKSRGNKWEVAGRAVRPGASGILVGVSEEEPGVRVLARAGVQGTASAAPLGCRSIHVLSSKGALSLLFWVMLLKPKVEGAGSASGSSASSRPGAVLAPDVNTASHLPNPGSTNPTDPPVPSLRNSITMETHSPAPAARQSEGGHF